MAFPANAPADALLAARPQIQDLATDTIAELAHLASTLPDAIPLWYGEGDVVTPAFIGAAAKAALDRGLTFYIPDMRGYGPLVEALAAYQSRIAGVPIGRDRATVTPGGMQAVTLALSLIVDLGTNVVIPEPQWPNIKRAVHMAGGEPRTVPMRFAGNDWSLDLERVFAACDARTRAIMFSTPSNPLGWTASRADFESLLDFGRKRGIWIISDECYNRLYFGPGGVAPTILSLAEPEDRVMTINTFSKAWAMTGWRVGWLSHPVSVAGKVGAMTQYMNSGTAGILQAGAHAAMTEGEDFVAATRERCRTGLELAYSRLEGLTAIELPKKPPGGMYAFFSLRGVDDATAACRQVLEKARVGLAPGTLFGAPASRYLRLCVCRDAGQLSTALERMVRALG